MFLRILEGRPKGATLWMRIHGRSMYPLLWSGQSLRIVRCGPEDVSVGDIAIGRRPDETLVAHVVAETGPVRLSTFFGSLDPVGTEILGRAAAVKTRGGRVIPLPRWTGRLVVPIRAGLRLVNRTPGLRFGARAVRVFLTSLDAQGRSIVGAPIHVQPLGDGDLDDALALAGDVTGGMHVEVEAAIREQRAQGLFQGRKLRALALREPDGQWRVIRPTHPTGEAFGRMLLEQLTRTGG